MFIPFSPPIAALRILRTKKKKVGRPSLSLKRRDLALIYQHFYSIIFLPVNRNDVSLRSTVICSLQLLLRSGMFSIKEPLTQVPASSSREFCLRSWSLESQAPLLSHRLKVILFQLSHSLARVLSSQSNSRAVGICTSLISSHARPPLTSAYSPKFPPLRRTCTDPPKFVTCLID